MLEQVLATPLDAGGLQLGSVGPGQRLTELEFYYPLTELSAGGLQQVLQRYGRNPGNFGEQIRELTFDPVRGFMKGFIDLVFEAGGRFYIVDYKSNWLGNSAADYRPQRLYEAMARDDYYLQYLIYSVAVHRYLRLRLADYDYDSHFGGVFYLFLRGMHPDAPDNGVFRDRPEKNLIEALDRYLDSGSVDAGRED
jgi:exodeoxyribonuclease V beta subunit